MKTKNKIFLAVFFIAVAVFFIVVYRNIPVLSEFIGTEVSRYGYPAVFILSLVADTIEQPIGPEVPGSIAIVFGLNVYLVFLFTVLGSYAGTFVSYYIGKRFLSNRVITTCEIGRYEKYCKLFKEHGRWALLVAAVTPVPYVLFLWMAGVFHLGVKNIILFGIFPRTLRIAAVFGLLELIA